MRLRVHGVWPFESRHLHHFGSSVRSQGFDWMMEEVRGVDPGVASVDDCFFVLAAAVLASTALGRPTPDVGSWHEDLVAEHEWEPSSAEAAHLAELVGGIAQGSSLRKGFEALEGLEPGITEEWVEAMASLRQRLLESG